MSLLSAVARDGQAAPEPPRGDQGRDAPVAHSNGHFVRFFERRDFPAGRIADFLHESLARGDGALVYATPSHLDALEERLRARGVNVTAEVESGALVMRDAGQIALSLASGGTLSKLAFDACVASNVERLLERCGNGHVYGEIVDVLARHGATDQALELERWWVELLKGKPVKLLCGYSLEAFADAASASAFRRVCDEHGVVEPVAEDAPHEKTEAIMADGSARVVAELQQTELALRGEVERSQTLERQRDLARRRLQLLVDASACIAKAKLDLHQVIDGIVHEVTRAGVAQCCVVNLLAEDGKTLPVAGMHHIDAEIGKAVALTLDETPVLRGAGIVGGVAESGEPVLLTTAEAAFAQTRQDYRPHLKNFPVSSLVVVALRVSGSIIGTLTASRQHPNASFTKDDQDLLQELADRAALSIEAALLYANARAERERAEKERERAEQERHRAESANRAKDEFLAMLGHELRNPLSPILTAVQLMELRAGDLLVKERTIILRQVNRMVRLVDDLLDVSRITRGKVELKRAPIELAKVVADAIEVASPLLEERSHRLSISVPAQGLVVEADPDRLAQVVSNLLTNAAKYTPNGGSVEINARVVNQSVVLAVRDSGAGIEPELLPNVFDLFVQGEQPSDRASGGLGLGLTIASKLVEMHGGSLRARSDGPGRGSEFTLELPLVESLPAPARASAAAVARAVSGLRVLVVDDNRDAASVLGEMLEERGFAVSVAHDGPSALEIAAASEPQLALLDIGLPVMDGYELARRLSVSEHALKLVALTGYGQEANRRQSREAGFEEHLVKPIDVGQLLSVIERLFPE